jgi:hypothetical protein
MRVVQHEAESVDYEGAAGNLAADKRQEGSPIRVVDEDVHPAHSASHDVVDSARKLDA